MNAENIGLGTFYRLAHVGGFRGSARDEMALFDSFGGVVAENAVSTVSGDFFPAYFIDELDAIPQPKWLVRDFIAEKSVGMLYGATGSLKTFVVLDVALSSIFSNAWADNKEADLAGLRIMRPLRVAVIAGEGGGNIGKRIRAWRKHHTAGRDEHMFAVIPQMPPFKDATLVGKLVNTVRNKLGTVDLLIVDTLMRAASGYNLNVPAEAQSFLDVCNAIGRSLDCAVLLVHHTGKNRALGPLGAENLKAYVDTVDCVTLLDAAGSKRVVEVRQEKSKDADFREPIYLESCELNLGSDDDGQRITSLVLQRVAKPASQGVVGESVRLRRATEIILEESALGRDIGLAELCERLAIAERRSVGDDQDVKKHLSAIRRWLNTQAKSQLSGYARQSGRGKTARWIFRHSEFVEMAGRD